MATWALALAYWLHLIATVVWVGGLALMALVVWPGAQAKLSAGPERGRLLSELNRRFNPLAWISLAVLTGTGLMQMSADPNYDGFLTIDNLWSAMILLKHLAVLGMVGLGAAMQWGVQPAIARLALLEERGAAPPELAALRRREARLMRWNLAGGLVVLLLTAIATAL